MLPENVERPLIFQKDFLKNPTIGSVVGKTDVQITASFFCLFVS